MRSAKLKGLSSELTFGCSIIRYSDITLEQAKKADRGRLNSILVAVAACSRIHFGVLSGSVENFCPESIWGTTLFRLTGQGHDICIESATQLCAKAVKLTLQDAAPTAFKTRRMPRLRLSGHAHGDAPNHTRI